MFFLLAALFTARNAIKIVNFNCIRYIRKIVNFNYVRYVSVVNVMLFTKISITITSLWIRCLEGCSQMRGNIKMDFSIDSCLFRLWFEQKRIPSHGKVSNVWWLFSSAGIYHKLSFNFFSPTGNNLTAPWGDYNFTRQ